MTPKFQIFRRKWKHFYNLCKPGETVNSARAADHPNNSFIFEMESLQTCPGPAGEEGDHGDDDHVDLPRTRLPRII